MLVQIGEGNIAMDVALFIGACAAAAVNIYGLPGDWRVSRQLAVVRVLRLVGWVLVASRFGYALMVYGDVAISIAGGVGILFLEAGQIGAVLCTKWHSRNNWENRA